MTDKEDLARYWSILFPEIQKGKSLYEAVADNPPGWFAPVVEKRGEKEAKKSLKKLYRALTEFLKDHDKVKVKSSKTVVVHDGTQIRVSFEHTVQRRMIKKGKFEYVGTYSKTMARVLVEKTAELLGSQNAIAKRLRVSPSAISQFKRGQMKSNVLFWRIYHLFKREMLKEKKDKKKRVKKKKRRRKKR